MCLILIRVAPDTDSAGYPANIFAGYLVWLDIRNPAKEKYRIFLSKQTYLYLVINKSAYRSLLYIDMILFVKTIFDVKQFF